MKPSPRVLPAGRHRLGHRAGESVYDALRFRRCEIRRKLEAVRALPLLEASRRDLEHDRSRLLGSRPPDVDGDTDEVATGQRNAARSFSKKPSSLE
jgi:hypothetical protein